MAIQQHTFPSMPPIGQAESFYAKLSHQADRVADIHLHESAKVGQYVTLALDPALTWEEKLKYFRHAIKRHCQPPPFPDEDIWMFYRQLADLVRQHCGQEALRIASQEDDLFAVRQSMGQDREIIENDAEEFFEKLLGRLEICPEWFNESDWEQLKMLRDQWI
ncbi:MAG: hypothetical protein ABSH20_01000 [Tepidisphaeraceae bacterium]|jgi:hypothetical protein